MKVLLVDPDNSYAQKLEGLSCAAMEVSILTSEQVGNIHSDSLRVDVILAGGNLSDRSSLIDRLLVWRTHPHSYLVPCWIAADYGVFESKCLWPRLAIDRFEERIEVQAFCDWLTAVVEWQQNRMQLPDSDTFANHGVLELVTSLALRRANGRLTVLGKERSEGVFVFYEGGLTHAALSQLRGEDAFYELLSWSSGSYSWEPRNSTRSEESDQPLPGLIDEGLWLLRDANLLYYFLPDMGYPIWRTESKSALDDGAVRHYEALKRLHALIDGRITARELIEASPLSSPRTMSWLAKWFSMGDIEAAAQHPVLSGEPVRTEAMIRQAEGPAEHDDLGFQEIDDADLEVTLPLSVEIKAPEAAVAAEPAVVAVQLADSLTQEVLIAHRDAGAMPDHDDVTARRADAVRPRQDGDGWPVGHSADLPPETPEAGHEGPDTFAAPAKPVPTHRLLIVDDSRLMCSALQSIFSRDPRFEIVGVAHDGFEALKLVEEAQPDVVTMDINMPRMDGLTALKHIMIRDPRPVVVLSAFTQETSKLTYDAFKYGAVNVFSKPTHKSPQQMEKEAERLRDGVSQASFVRLEAAQYIRRRKKNQKTPEEVACSREIHRAPESHRPVAAIGCGAGGFPSLLKLLFSISRTEELPWIIACMAMPRRVVEAMVPNLAEDCQMKIQVASPGEPLEPGIAYLYSHEECLHVSVRDGRISLDRDPSCDASSRPLDHLWLSTVECLATRAMALLISGRGTDGFEGLGHVRRKGGLTFALSPDVCLSPDLPRKVLEAGRAMEVKTVAQLASLLERCGGHLS
jgi:two-component system, chemotaxis family, protein-glutamate methylesterase/glutaminase